MIEEYDAFWTYDRHYYVIVPESLPDGTVSYGIYNRDGTCATIAVAELNRAVVDLMLEAEVPIVDPFERDLLKHEALWTWDFDTHLVVQDVPGADGTIYDHQGEVYPVEAELRAELIARIVAAGARVVSTAGFSAVMAELQEAWRKRIELADRRLKSYSLKNGVKRRWLRRRIDGIELTPQKKAESYWNRIWRGRVTLAEVEARYPALIAQMEAGDELWSFSNPQGAWEELVGRAGFCLVRGREPITRFIVELMN